MKKALIVGLSFLLMQALQAAGLVNINKADVKTLAALKGIGQKRAEAVIAYRQQHGAFGQIEELVNVKGIGQSFLTNNKHLLTVGN